MDNADMFCNTIWDALASQALANWRREVQGLRAGCLLLQLSSDVLLNQRLPWVNEFASSASKRLKQKNTFLYTSNH